MAIPSLTSETLPHFVNRFERLEAETPRKFGTMDTTKMLRHMRNAFETAIGETDLPDESIPVVRKVLFVLIAHVITTWPGGRIKAPDYWSPETDKAFDEERALCRQALDRFVDTVAKEPDRVSSHPILGPLTLKQWSRLNGVHFHHHLRQFGV